MILVSVLVAMQGLGNSAGTPTPPLPIEVEGGANVFRQRLLPDMIPQLGREAGKGSKHGCHYRDAS